MSLIKSKKHLLSAFDEICIKENLVHDKHNGQVIGYVNLGDVNNQLIALKSACNSDKQQYPAVATHMLATMVRELVTGLKFPFAHFFTAGVTTDFLIGIMWNAVEQL